MADVLTDNGEAYITDVMNGTAPGTGYVGWGTGAGTAAKADTALFTEASEARTSCTRTRVTTTSTNDTIQWVGTIVCAGAGKTITNAGILNAATAGTLILHSNDAGTALNIGDSIQYTFKLQFT